jgi:L-fuconolactonase
MQMEENRTRTRRSFFASQARTAGLFAISTLLKSENPDGTARKQAVPVVDSHQHFWDTATQRLPPPPPGQAMLGRSYLPADLSPELRRAGVDYTVFVQAKPESRATNQWMFRVADATDFIAGVVAWLDLTKPDSVHAELSLLQKEPKFAGVRAVAGGEPGWMNREPVVESLSVLAREGIAFDMLVKPRDLTNVITLIERLPKLRMVIDHIASPEIAAGKQHGWAEPLVEIGRHPQICCKLSGMVTEADWKAWRPEQLQPYADRVLEIFGWERIMYGSDWPVCLLAAGYQRVWRTAHQLVERGSPEQRQQVFGANAIRFYRLKLPRSIASTASGAASHA